MGLLYSGERILKIKVHGLVDNPPDMADIWLKS